MLPILPPIRGPAWQQAIRVNPLGKERHLVVSDQLVQRVELVPMADGSQKVGCTPKPLSSVGFKRGAPIANAHFLVLLGG